MSDRPTLPSEITPAMIEAGARELADTCGIPEYYAEAILPGVLAAMADASESCCGVRGLAELRSRTARQNGQLRQMNSRT